MPTKITNSLRQIRTHLRSDGVACYFDPYLEAEALGATSQYVAEDQSPTLQWPHRAEPGELPENVRSPEDTAKSARVAVAVEVIQRLKSLMRDDLCYALALAVRSPSPRIFSICVRQTRPHAKIFPTPHWSWPPPPSRRSPPNLSKPAQT